MEENKMSILKKGIDKGECTALATERKRKRKRRDEGPIKQCDRARRGLGRLYWRLGGLGSYSPVGSYGSR